MKNLEEKSDIVGFLPNPHINGISDGTNYRT